MKKKREKIRGRAAAIIGMVLLITLSTPLGMCLSLNRERSEATEVYYGSEDTFGLLEDLEDCRAAAANLVTLGGKYLPADNEQLSDVKEASRFVEEATAPQEKAAALSELTNSMNALYNALCLAEPDEQGAVYREEIFSDYNASLDMINRSEYNTRAAEFNAVLKNSPGRPLAALVGIRELEPFA